MKVHELFQAFYKCHIIKWRYVFAGVVAVNDFFGGEIECASMFLENFSPQHSVDLVYSVNSLPADINDLFPA